MKALLSILLAAGVAHAAPRVEFTGNTTVPAAALRQYLASNASPLFDDAEDVVQEVLERDLLLVSAYYWDHGYANVKLGTPRVEHALVSIPVEEGAVFTMGSVTATGELIGTAAENLAKIKIRAGMTFSRTTIADDREHLATFYEDLGYAYASVMPLTKIDNSSNRIAINFEVKRGKLARIERIEVFGSHVSEPAIRQAMLLAKGDLFSETKLEKSKQQVKALGFANVTVSTTRGTTDELIVIKVETN